MIKTFTIHRLGPQGDGVHESPHGKIFFERTAPGDCVRAHVYQDRQGIFRGEVQELLESSPNRQEAPCSHYDDCGNCTLQHLNQTFYRHWKLETVREAFRKKGLRPRKWTPAVFVGENNRRRLTLSARKENGKLFLGYHRRRSQEVVHLRSCLIAEPAFLEIHSRLVPLLRETIKERNTLDIFLQMVGATIDSVLTGPLTLAERNLLKERLRQFPNLHRVGWRADETSKIQILFEKCPIQAQFGDLLVPLPPDAFLQPTLEGERALIQSVLHALPPKGKFADLFSGCGTFSGAMLQRGSVDAYESVPSAVHALGKAGQGKRLKVFRRDLFKHPLRKEELNAYDAVVFDPPRAGCEEQAARLASAKTRTVIGVSCNPSTFARDAKILCEGGYWLQSLQVVDQFRWSHHVEVVGVFTKQKNTATPFRRSPNRS